jgi:outer membrane lipoprotein-sorting protein
MKFENYRINQLSLWGYPKSPKNVIASSDSSERSNLKYLKTKRLLHRSASRNDRKITFWTAPQIFQNKSFLILFLFSIYGVFFINFFTCSSPKEITKVLPKISIPEVIYKANANANKIQTLRASGNITIELPDNANSGAFKLNLSKPDSISLKITGPFGINAVKALVTRDTFLFYNAFENVIVTGRTSGRTLKDILKIKVDFDEIMTLLSCLPDFHREGLTALPTETVTEQNEYIFIYKNEETVIKYWFNPEISVITKRCTFDSKGKVLTEERYESYEKINDCWFPKSIQVILHQERQSLSLYYENIEVNLKDPDFSFNVPDDIKIVHWR